MRTYFSMSSFRSSPSFEYLSQRLSRWVVDSFPSLLTIRSTDSPANSTRESGRRSWSSLENSRKNSSFEQLPLSSRSMVETSGDVSSNLVLHLLEVHRLTVSPPSVFLAFQVFHLLPAQATLRGWRRRAPGGCRPKPRRGRSARPGRPRPRPPQLWQCRRR